MLIPAEVFLRDKKEKCIKNSFCGKSFIYFVIGGEKIVKKSIFKFDTKTVVTIGIAGALYGVLGFVGFPIGPNTYIKPAVAILTIFGALFGPVVGFLAGFIGHAITDMIAGWGIWWGWVMSSALMGLFMGLIYTYSDFSVKDGIANKKHVAYMVVTGLIGIVIAFIFAGSFDIFVMGEPYAKIKVQVIGSMISNILVLFVLGIPAVLGFVKINKKNSNLSIDK